MFNVDESTDDFVIHVYRKNENLFFIWKLNDNPYRKIENYPNEALLVGVDFHYFKKTVNEFDEMLSVLKKSHGNNGFGIH